jgi:hypothetical protein
MRRTAAPQAAEQSVRDVTADGDTHPVRIREQGAGAGASAHRQSPSFITSSRSLIGQEQPQNKVHILGAP